MKWLQWPYLFLLGAFNRDTPLGRILLIPVALIYCAMAKDHVQAAYRG